MSATSWILLVGAALTAIVLLRPRFAGNPTWRAVVTPLASIIGSGFLVAGPILSDAVGQLAYLAMFGLCALAYLFGAVIRFNIRHVEPLLAAHPPWRVTAIERASDLVLAFAYFISVAYYLNLFAAFGLRAFGVVDPVAIRLVTSAVLVSLAAAGLAGGLKAFERIETLAVGLKLAVIAGLLLALGAAMAMAAAGGDLVFPQLDHPRGWREVQIVLGLVVLVQGFETSRYLGADHDAETRIRTMRWAQWLSSAIYVAFLVLAAPYFVGPLPAEGGETEIITMLMPLGLVIVPAITLAALASQLSAAVADLNGAGGLLGEQPLVWLTERLGYIVTAIAALAITWVANIYEIIAFASKAFVIYYGLQSLQAFLLAASGPTPHWPRAAVFGLATLVAIVIVIAAAPVSA